MSSTMPDLVMLCPIETGICPTTMTKLWYLDADFLREFLVLCPYLLTRASPKILTNTFHLTPVPAETYLILEMLLLLSTSSTSLLRMDVTVWTNRLVPDCVGPLEPEFMPNISIAAPQIYVLIP